MAKPTTPGVGQMRDSIRKLDRRIAELEGFDLASVTERSDSHIEQLRLKVVATLEEVVGRGSDEFYRFITPLNTLPLSLGGVRLRPESVRAGYAEGIANQVQKLRTLRELIDERIADTPEEPTEAPARKARGSMGNRRVFVVHGHDEGAKNTVARYLSQIGLEPIILHEQTNRGRTVIEKFEDHSDVSYAVVLFTPDDIGYPAGDAGKAKARARQNVVLELGYFAGVLGRDRVAVLHRGEVEIPSDYLGVLYLQFDEAEAWKLPLAREIHDAGVDVDLNALR